MQGEVTQLVENNDSEIEEGKVFRDYLWCPEKIQYIRRHHQKRKFACTLCEIVKKNPQVPSWELFRDNRAMVVLNIYPFNPGHLMVVPLKHFENYEDLNDDLLLHLNKLVQDSIILLKDPYNPDGFNVGINQGYAGGGSIKHLHIQIVPRYKREANFFDIFSGTRVIVEGLKDTYEKLMEKIKTKKYFQTNKK